MANDSEIANATASPSQNEITLLEIVNGLLRNWRLLIVLPLLFAFVAGVHSLAQERSFVARGSFVTQSGDSRNVGGAAALAQQFGFDLGTERPGQSPAFYVDLLKSTTLLRRVVEAEYRVPSDTAPDRVTNLVEYWTQDLSLRDGPPWRSAVDRLRRAVSASVVRETGVVELAVTTDNPLLSEQIAERLLSMLNEYNLEMRQSRALEEARFIGGRVAEVQAELGAAEDAVDAFRRQNRNFLNSPDLTSDYQRLERQLALRQEVYLSLLRAQEQTRIDGMRDTPLLTVIDAPAGTAVHASRRVMLRITIAFLLGVLAAVGLATTYDAARRARLLNDPRHLEFEALVRQFWTDVRNPRRWFQGHHSRTP